MSAKRYIYTSVAEPWVIYDSDHDDLAQALVYNDADNGGEPTVGFARVAGSTISDQEVKAFGKTSYKEKNAYEVRVVDLVIAPEATKLATALVKLDFLARRAMGKTLNIFRDDMDRALLFTLSERMREQLDIVDQWCEENDA